MKYRLYESLHRQIKKIHTGQFVPEQTPLNIHDADILVLGMGRTGKGAYDYLVENTDHIVVGVEEQHDKTVHHRSQRRRVIEGDATSMDFWERIDVSQVRLILMTLTNLKEVHRVTDLLHQRGYQGELGAVSRYDDEAEELLRHGINTFNVYAESGAGFAEHIHREVLNG